MTGRRRERARWMLVVTFAAGMAWVEAACVYYLRVMVDRVEPYQPDPLPIRGILGEVELVREGATLLMLAMTGMLAGRTWRARLGATACRSERSLVTQRAVPSVLQWARASAEA